MKYPYASSAPRGLTTPISIALTLALVVACQDDTTSNDEVGDTGTETGETGDGDGDGDSAESDTTDTDTTDATETDSTDATESTDSTDATESTDSTDTTDGTDTTDTTDGTDSTDSTDGTDTTDTEPDEDTIYAIQDGTIPVDTPVDVQGVWVTGVRDNGFYAQEPTGGQFSGVWVYVGDMGPDISGLEIGDVVDITGITTEFAELTEVDASMGTVTEVGTIAPIAPDLVTTADLGPDVGEPWESVLVRLESELAVTDLPGFDEFVVSDANGSVVVDNYIYNLIADGGVDFPSFGLGATFTAIQGPVNFTFGNYKLVPRSAADLEGYVAPVNPILGVDDLAAGDLVITEIMYNPNTCVDANCEWIEVFNATDNQVDLNGLRIQDSQLANNAQGTVAGSLVVNPGQYVMLGKGPLANWTYTIQADAFTGATNPAFNNGAGDFAVILNSNSIIDQTAPYPMNVTGKSWKLNGAPDATTNDMAANWCYSTTDFGNGDLGSPKAANEVECNPMP